MWIFYALLLHILLLGSIFTIYFRSPVITGLEPQSSLTTYGLEPPAKRLVLIVTDGLRSESFFKNKCADIPHLRGLIEKQGIAGISRTRVPTESRPGHIALIAGLYEDPSAVTRGWKENPIQFDTLFNRSGHVYAWGAYDVLHIFVRPTDDKRRMHFDAYNHELDFSGKENTYKLDEWVFKRVPLLLERKKEELVKAQQVVFFLHLLGLDTAGHVHKPGTKLFLENLHYTEREIVKIYETFEKTFPDRQTAYVLTSDHGMTDTGSHGAGDPHETDTPFYLWGAGIAIPPIEPQRTFDLPSMRKPLYELEQAQLTPLMSALIGLPPPMNNFGMLPVEFLNASKKYIAHAVHSNALQLLAQYRRLRQQHDRGYFSKFMRSFRSLGYEHMWRYKEGTAKLLLGKEFNRSIENSYMVIWEALKGIQFYHNYYSNALLVSTVATFIGWMFYLQLQLQQRSHQQLQVSKKRAGAADDDDDDDDETVHNYLPSMLCLLCFVLFFVVLQRLSYGIALYFVLPVVVWMLALREYKMKMPQQIIVVPKWELLAMIGCAELLVLSFFERGLISLGYVIFTCANNTHMFERRDRTFYLWIFLLIVLLPFSLLPSAVGYQNMSLLYISMASIVLRTFIVDSDIKLRNRFINMAGLLNAAICIYLHTNHLSVPYIMYMLSWCFLVYTIAVILLDNETLKLKHRVELIFFNLNALYVLLCTSYEAQFIQLLASELMLTLLAKQASYPPPQYQIVEDQRSQIQKSLRLALVILLYTFFSIFGTGNIASISSFDPNIIRCLLQTFAPFLIMGLVLLKLIIPIVLNISIIFGLSETARKYQVKIFISMLLICDIMGLNFLFLVRNEGSWLEIGTSISHFVIMEATTLVLLLLTIVAKLFLKLPAFVQDIKAD